MGVKGISENLSYKVTIVTEKNKTPLRVKNNGTKALFSEARVKIANDWRRDFPFEIEYWKL